VGDDATAYFMDQLFAIAVCGALACITLVLWQSGLLGRMIHPKFHPLVLTGGLILLGLVTIRAIAVWLEAGQLQSTSPSSHGHSHGGQPCTHDHGGQATAVTPSVPLAPVTPSHAHTHSHGDGAACTHDHGAAAIAPAAPTVDEHAGHSHGWAPWRYIVLLLPILLYFLALSNPVFDQEPNLITKPFSVEPLPYITSFIIIFRSILWEALPFIVLGALIAGLLDELLPQRWLTAVIPRNPFLAVAIGGLLGLVFPICECGIVPIMRRLLRKGLPLSACVAYLLAGPIVNPVVIGSTFAAFNGMEDTFIGGKPAYQMSGWWMVLFRTGIGYIVAVTTAMVVEWMWQKHGSSLLTPLTRPSALPEADIAETGPRPSAWQRVSNISQTSIHDFVDITVFLILGALLAAGTRMFLTPEMIADLGSQHIMLTLLLMMGLAIILCLCSEADAFVAASFVTLPPSAKVSFLVLGPMVDIKLYALYLLIFRPRLIATIYFCVVGQVFVYSVATHYFWDAYKEHLVTPKVPEGEKMNEADVADQAARYAFALSSLGTANNPTQFAVATAWLTLDPQEKATEMRFLALEAAAESAPLRTFYQSKLVWMSGRFSGTDRGFMLIRYKYNCCAADAVPLQAYLVPKDPLLTVPAEEFQGRWVKVTGRIDFRLDRGRYVPFIVLSPPDKRSWDKIIQTIEQPTNPFIY
jgi:uncharacterized membrane protein YraQ (UPF0718 family)